MSGADFDAARERRFLAAVEARLEEAERLHLWISMNLNPEAVETLKPGLTALVRKLRDLRRHCHNNLRGTKA